MTILARLPACCVAFFTMLAVSASSCDEYKDNLSPEMIRELQKLEKNVTRQVISEGEFWGISIGDSKRSVLDQLKSAGIHELRPVVLEKKVIENPKDLGLLRQEQAVILFPGDVRVSFYGDDVHELQLLPSVETEWRTRLESAITRDEVFAVFAAILERDKRAAVGNYLPDARWVRLLEISDDDVGLLRRHDAWEMPYDNKDGFWHLRLEFSEDRLARIFVNHSPVELP